MYAQLHQADGMALCLLRAEPEETVIQCLGCHGKAGKISMADSCGVRGFDSFYLLPKPDIHGSQERTSRKHYYFSLDRRETVHFRYMGYEKRKV